MTFNHLTSDRFKARPITHVRPPTPEQWQDVDLPYFEAIEAEIKRQANGGDPSDAPWSSARYFDTVPQNGAAGPRVFAVLRHLSGEAITRLIVMGHLLRNRVTGPKPTPAAEAHTCLPAGNCTHTADQNIDLHTRTRTKESTISPSDRGNTVPEEQGYIAALCR
ncbi:hypothetical protein FNV65_06730 [Streptomyces sp. S1A1-8]|uniref:hypothetical protein n=1 Tax=unclassified Streptomyces TaxID=2593676 RepID=UPI00116546B8|nr:MULTISPECIES: hypothetical protein [unclassified Streptomyces]QDN96027.1 hypothetical protein FNV58_08155 [Streptomyces sp. RLB1-9]QDO17748.1 hypothetical protein FNV65_06730 [Streptomyces sp. S1A1-8]QDO27876.1 hypothetical protein FNV63_06740 [Streptomyces sp. S1A1-3]